MIPVEITSQNAETMEVMSPYSAFPPRSNVGVSTSTVMNSTIQDKRANLTATVLVSTPA